MRDRILRSAQHILKVTNQFTAFFYPRSEEQEDFLTMPEGI